MKSHDILTLLLTGAVAVAAVAGIAPDSSGHEPIRFASARACPLTLAQEVKATAAFEKMMPVLTHPRCFNCHGGVDPFKPADEGGHIGGEMIRPDTGAQCRECHTNVRNLRRPGATSEWESPLDPFHFVGKGARELCNHFKTIESGPPAFVGHMINENGGNQFTEAAYRGERNLNAFGRSLFKEATGQDVVPEPPPIPHAELIAHAREWATTVGAAGWKTPDCGCQVRVPTWEGTVSTSWTQREPGFGTLTETMYATARFEIDSSLMIPGDSAIAWKTTSGVLRWTVTATGGVCTTSASGMAPIRLGADSLPWGTIRMEPDGAGGIGYSVGIGPWPDEYQPRYVYRCTREVKMIHGIPFAMLSWWHHPDTVKLTPDGKAMKGTFSNTHMLGTIRWSWDFKFIQ